MVVDQCDMFVSICGCPGRKLQCHKDLHDLQFSCSDLDMECRT